MKKIYIYNKITKEYIGERPVKLDPRGGRPMVPANATLDSIPVDLQEGNVWVFNDEWTQVEDHRGELWYDGTSGNEITIDILGPIDESLVDEYIAPFSEESVKTNIVRLSSKVIDGMMSANDRELLSGQSIRLLRREMKGIATVEESAILDATEGILTRIEEIKTKEHDLTNQYISAGKNLTSNDITTITTELSRSYH